MKTAIENWKVVDEAARLGGRTRWPIDVFIVHMVKFCELLVKKNITAEDIERHNRKSAPVIAEAMRAAETFTADAGGAAKPTQS